MKRMRTVRCVCICALLFAVTLSAVTAAPGLVRLEKKGNGFQLLRNGEPCYIKGAGGDKHLDVLVAAGGNSIRTWGTDGVEGVLDEAQKYGVSVTVGFWLGHERHGFNYNDAAAVRKQWEKCRDAVLQYKSHPALLMWAVGNEMEGSGENVAIWKAVEEIAAMCKKEDPGHPAMTVVAELGAGCIKSKMIHEHCPSIDIIGINSYGGALSLAKRYLEANGTKPYVVTEFGPIGQWEVEKSAWGAPIEQNSTDKANHYRQSYLAAIKGQPLCLGSYVFLWGNKMEVTETWFSMILRGGLKTKAVEVMAEMWTGKLPVNRCPDISNIKLDRDSGLKPGDEVRATVKASDPDGDAISMKWGLLSDSGQAPQGGDFQKDEAEFPDAIVRSDSAGAVIKIPESGGRYRVAAYALDGKGNAATVNAPLQVEGAVVPVKLMSVKLPFVVYDDVGGKSPYFPSGYMGNHSAISMDPSCKDKPYKGNSCLKVTYSVPDNWGGVVWQSPANDWGKEPGGFNLKGATELEFWVRGENGGEILAFLVGAIKDDQPYSDSARVELKDIKLLKEWTKYRIPLDGRDLSRIKTGFGWTLAGQGKTVTFYLDEIRFVGN